MWRLSCHAFLISLLGGSGQLYVSTLYESSEFLILTFKEQRGDENKIVVVVVVVTTLFLSAI
jgi:hypothetical protein